MYRNVTSVFVRNLEAVAKKALLPVAFVIVNIMVDPLLHRLPVLAHIGNRHPVVKVNLDFA